MLSGLCRTKAAGNLRKKFPKPPVILKMPEEYFCKPRQELANTVPPFQKELDDHISGMLKRVNTKYNQSKREKFKDNAKPSEYYDSLKYQFEIDKDTGILKDAGFDEEIESLKARSNKNTEETAFVNNIDELIKKMHCLNKFEFFEFFKHSIALKTAKDMGLKMKGELLNLATKNVLESLGDTKDLTVEALTDKLAMKVIYAKIETILTEQKNDSAIKYNKIIDAIINDPQIEFNGVMSQDLIDRIYTVSKPEVDIKDKETHEEKLNKSYINRKIDILSVFADLPLNKEINLLTEKLDYKFRFLQGIIEKKTFKEGDSLEQQLTTIKLKELLGYPEIVDSIDSKIQALERKLGVSNVKMPAKEIINKQLNIILHTMPDEFKNKMDNVRPARNRYLNSNYKSNQLQWQNIDLQIPADIMPVKEYLGREQKKKDEKYLHTIMPEYIPTIPEQEERDLREKELYNDTAEMNYSPVLNLEYEMESKRTKNAMRDYTEEKINSELKLSEYESEVVKDDNNEELIEIKPLRPQDPTYDAAEENLGETERRYTKSNAALKDWRKKRCFTNLYGHRSRVPVSKLKQYEYENGWYIKESQFIRKVNADKEEEIKDFVEPFNFERRDFFNEIRNQYEKYEVPENLEKSKLSPLFDYINKTNEVVKSETENFDETMQRAVEVYKEVNSTMFHKHYLSRLFKMQQMDNGLQSNEMLDPEDDPNFGMMKNNVMDQFSNLSVINDTELQPEYIPEEKPDPLYYEGIAPTYFGSGTRKRSKAFAVVELPGTGKVSVNNRDFLEYFQEPKDRVHMLKSVVAIGKTCEVDLKVYAHGGGTTSQADAALVAISNALIKAFPEVERFLVDRYFTYIDRRRVERKKTSKFKARKSYTYVRR